MPSFQDVLDVIERFHRELRLSDADYEQAKTWAKLPTDAGAQDFVFGKLDERIEELTALRDAIAEL